MAEGAVEARRTRFKRCETRLGKKQRRRMAAAHRAADLRDGMARIR
jgi:hypothetical protein